MCRSPRAARSGSTGRSRSDLDSCPASGMEIRGSGLRPRCAGLAKDGERGRAGPRGHCAPRQGTCTGTPVSGQELTGRGSSPKLDGCFAAEVERARVRSPRKREGAGRASPGEEGDRAAGSPTRTHTTRRPPGTSEAPSAAALTHRR